MADDEVQIHIEKVFWPRGVVRGLTPALRALGDKHGNMVIAAQPTKGALLVKGTPEQIAACRAALIALIEEHFPDAPLPVELGGAAGVGAAAPCGDQWQQEEDYSATPPYPAPESVPVRAATAQGTVPVLAHSRATASAGAEVQAEVFRCVAPFRPEHGLGRGVAARRKAVRDPLRSADMYSARVLAASGFQQPPMCKLRTKGHRHASQTPDLVWQCIRGASSFTRRSRTTGLRQAFSAELGNLTSFHARRFSGVANEEVVDVRPVWHCAKESIELLKSNRLHRPIRATKSTGLHKCCKRGLATLERELTSKLYNRTLCSLARLKYLKVRRSFQKRSRHVPRRQRCAPCA